MAVVDQSISAEVSSIKASLEEITKRVTSIAEQLDRSGKDDRQAHELYAVERALIGCVRRLDKSGKTSH